MNVGDIIILILLGLIIVPYFIGRSSKKITIYSSKNIPKAENLTQRKETELKSKEFESNKIISLKNNWIESKRREIYNFKSVVDILNEYEINKISYSVLLNSFEWQCKRFKILYRDKFKCVDCCELSESLHVHHLYYLKDAMPWEIEDKALVSLCRNCHSKRHELGNIHVYRKVINKLVLENEFILTCPKCGGTGYLPHYHHVENGICFLCFGNIINKTVFSHRLQYILQNQEEYNFNKIFDEYNDFISLISSEYYYNYIHGKLYDEITDFFSPENTIIYKPGQNELLDFLMKSEIENTNVKNVNDPVDDLPF